MSEARNEFVTSVKKEDNQGSYRLHTIWKDDSFRINIAAQNASWSGEMTAEEVKKWSSQRQTDSKGYLKTCREALTTNEGKRGLKYMVENGSFVWKEVVDEDAGMTAKVGAVKVEPTNFIETIQKIIDVALKDSMSLKTEINNLHEEINKLSDNNNKYLKALDEAKNSKIKMENDLYEKFIELLNSKKKMILDLQNKLEGKEGVAVKQKITKASKPPPPKKKRLVNSRKNLSDKEAYEVETENDSDDDVVPIKSQRRSTRLSAKNSQSDNSQNSQDIVTRKRTSKISEPLESKKTKSDVEIDIDSDSTISDESLFNLGKNLNEEDKTEKIKESEPEKVKTPEKISPQKSKEKKNSVPPDTQDLLDEIWG